MILLLPQVFYSQVQENHRLLNTYFMLERFKEEIEFVKQEMKSALAFFFNTS